MAIVTPGFFEALGARIVAGRTFTEEDDTRHPRVIVVNRAFAARFFPGEPVIGRMIEPGISRRFGRQDCRNNAVPAWARRITTR